MGNSCNSVSYNPCGCNAFQECYTCGDNVSLYCYAKPAAVIPLVITLTVLVLVALTVMYFLIRRREDIARSTGIPYMIMGSDSSRWFRLVVFVVMGLMVFSYGICSIAFIPFNSGTNQGSVDGMFWVLTVVLAGLMVFFAMYIARANSMPPSQRPLLSQPDGSVYVVDAAYVTPFNPQLPTAMPVNHTVVPVTPASAVTPTSPSTSTGSDNAVAPPLAVAGHVHAGRILPNQYTTFNDQSEADAEGEGEAAATSDGSARS